MRKGNWTVLCEDRDRRLMQHRSTQKPYCYRNTVWWHIASYWLCQLEFLTEGKFDSDRSVVFSICLMLSILQRSEVTWQWQCDQGNSFFGALRVICSVNTNWVSGRLLLRHWPLVAVMPSNSAWSSTQLLPPAEETGNSCNKTGKKEENNFSWWNPNYFLKNPKLSIINNEMNVQTRRTKGM